MLKQRIIIITFAIAAFLTSLFLTMPAHQAYQWGLFTPDVEMQGISGRFISGQSKRIIVNGVILRNVTWSLQALTLLTGKFALAWQIDGDSIKGHGLASINLLGKSQISNAIAMINIEQWSHYLPPGNNMKGSVNFDVSSASFTGKLESISAIAISDKLIVNTIVGMFDISKLSLTVKGTHHEEFQLQLKEIDNANNMDVIAEIKNNSINVSGYINAESKLARQLTTILPIIAKKQGQQWEIEWQGELPS